MLKSAQSRYLAASQWVQHTERPPACQTTQHSHSLFNNNKRHRICLCIFIRRPLIGILAILELGASGDYKKARPPFQLVLATQWRGDKIQNHKSGSSFWQSVQVFCLANLCAPQIWVLFYEANWYINIGNKINRITLRNGRRRRRSRRWTWLDTYTHPVTQTLLPGFNLKCKSLALFNSPVVCAVFTFAVVVFVVGGKWSDHCLWLHV